MWYNFSSTVSNDLTKSTSFAWKKTFDIKFEWKLLNPSNMLTWCCVKAIVLAKLNYLFFVVSGFVLLYWGIFCFLRVFILRLRTMNFPCIYHRIYTSLIWYRKICYNCWICILKQYTHCVKCKYSFETLLTLTCFCTNNLVT